MVTLAYPKETYVIKKYNYVIKRNSHTTYVQTKNQHSNVDRINEKAGFFKKVLN